MEYNIGKYIYNIANNSKNIDIKINDTFYFVLGSIILKEYPYILYFYKESLKS